jgi:hypothetical protein
MLAVDERPPILNPPHELAGKCRNVEPNTDERLPGEERAPAPAPLRVSDPARHARGSGPAGARARPRGPNASEEDRAENRRVELVEH